MNEVLDNVKEKSLGDKFKNLAVKTGKQNNFQAYKNDEKAISEAAKDRKPKAKQTNMPKVDKFYAYWFSWTASHAVVKIIRNYSVKFIILNTWKII